MRRTASERVGELAGLCTDPQEAERQMREAIKWGLEQNKRTIRMIKLERLWKVKVLSSKSFCCSLLLSVLDTVLLTKVLANKTEKIFPASECSKDPFESLCCGCECSGSTIIICHPASHSIVVKQA